MPADSDPAAGARHHAPPTGAEPADGPGGVIAVTRALQLLDAFALGESCLSLAALSRRCGLHRSTVLRLARTLARSGFMVQREDGDWRLGPAAGWLGARYQAGFDVQNVLEPALRELTQTSGESAAFYVREGRLRTCLVRVEGPQALRQHARMGEGLPLDRGSPGRVILAFSGESGAAYEDIRRRGYHWSIGEREQGVATVSAPVFGRHGQLLGSVCISGPAARLPVARLHALAPALITAANRLSYALSGSATAPTVRASHWHP
ncbi:IclR family transcriptional regulator [Verminephrobacter aporrectodeae subsp. tuberculatae]|uniref:IclR family transcriptional regulator n=1 Tax=Verminephrobacter aporrectodeae subsp. tuberculatae TaxID=1110392 RepID=A0ABT3KQJ3_9BURK|nr:IclR family transcriptional regulator [Verminephrobacter aporrectodeae]MCW5255563.1 IclR family transcriptional regulator [Verminephrobacter aporrectodeae subsp. tuberculatae]MCW5320592.1 IclR family transcriptional regulator [Verminephrobacter aporrectodeae subsp. tuberculatae]MCW8198414.1 IclR family transcriptional regulator [Verminephrobacter aporrectodeae subsp. tuberculatae]